MGPGCELGVQGQGHRGQGDGKAGAGQHYWQRWAGETPAGQAEGPSGFHFSPLNCFPPCRAATPAAGDSGCRTPQCLGRSVGILERHFRLGPLSRGKAAAEGRAGTGPQEDGQGNLCDYVVLWQAMRAGTWRGGVALGREMRAKGLLTHVPPGFVSPPLTKRP